jgi:hypothetical protein
VAEHVLKVWPEPFAALAEGRKTFEWRRDDRGFAVDDRLELREFDPARGQETGRALEAGVSYVLRGAFGVPEGYAVLSLVGVRPRRDQLAQDRALVDRLCGIGGGLTEWEVMFVDSLSKWIGAGRPLTEKQRERALQIDERA